jgi:uncharacterized protein (TIGR02147 family)
VDGDPKALARMLSPSITPKEAEDALGVLTKMGFIRKNADGFFEQTHQAITTGEGWKDVAIRQYQMDMIRLSSAALEYVSVDRRDISTLTMSVSGSCFDIIRERLKVLRDEITALVKNDTDIDRVYQLNLALFPLSSEDNGTGEKRGGL